MENAKQQQNFQTYKRAIKTREENHGWKIELEDVFTKFHL